MEFYSCYEKIWKTFISSHILLQMTAQNASWILKKNYKKVKKKKELQNASHRYSADLDLALASLCLLMLE